MAFCLLKTFFTILPTLLILTSSSLILNITGLKVISWKSSIDNTQQKLAIFGLKHRNTLLLTKIDQIPYDYRVVNVQESCNMITSAETSPIYQTQSIQTELNAQFVHTINNKLEQTGYLTTTSQSITESLPQTKNNSRPFSHTLLSLLSPTPVETSHNLHYLLYHNSIYSLNSALYSSQPKCYLLSHPNQELICEIGCKVKTPKQIIDGYNQKDETNNVYENIYTSFQALKDSQGKVRVLQREFEDLGIMETVKVMLNVEGIKEQDVLIDQIILGKNAVKLFVDLNQYPTISLTLQNTLQSAFALTHLQIWQSSLLLGTTTYLLPPSSSTTITQHIQNLHLLKIILINDMKNAQIYTGFVQPVRASSYHQDQKEQIGNRLGDRVEEERTPTIVIIIGIVGGVVGMIVIGVIGRFLWKHRNVQKQGKYKNSESNCQETKKETEGTQIDDHYLGESSGREINPQQPPHRNGKIQKITSAPKDAIGLESVTKFAFPAARLGKDQTLRDYLPPSTLQSLRDRARDIGQLNLQ